MRADALAPGSRILDRYEVRRTLGLSGTAITYRGTDLETGRPVAVKVGNEPAHEKSALWKGFVHEFEGVVRVDHPQMVEVIEFGRTPEGHPVLVTDFVVGLTLESLLAAGPMDPDVARPVFLGIASVLAAAHRLEVIHRDLTPRNVIVRDPEDSPEAIVIDFGLAKIGDDSGSQRLMGTPGYIAPEQVRGRAEAASDVYALGSMLWYAVTGSAYLAEPDDAPLQTVRRHFLAREAADPRKVNRRIPTSLAMLIRECLDPKPAARPSATELLTRLHVAFGERVDPNEDTAAPFVRRSDQYPKAHVLRPQSSANMPPFPTDAGTVVLEPLATLEQGKRVLVVDIDVPRRERFRGWIEGHGCSVVCAHRLRDIEKHLNKLDLVVLAGDLPGSVVHRFIEWLEQALRRLEDEFDVVVYAASETFSSALLPLVSSSAVDPDVALQSHFAAPPKDELEIPPSARFIGEMPELLLNLHEAVEEHDLATRRWICQHISELADPVGASDIRAQAHAIAQTPEVIALPAVVALVEALEASYLEFARWNLL